MLEGRSNEGLSWGKIVELFGACKFWDGFDKSETPLPPMTLLIGKKGIPF